MKSFAAREGPGPGVFSRFERFLRGRDHESEAGPSRRVSTAGPEGDPIAQAVNASVDMYLSGGGMGNGRKSWGVGGMFSFEEIAMGLNDVTVQTLEGVDPEGATR